MIRQPWGCILALPCLILGLAAGASIGWGLARCTGLNEWSTIVVCCVVLGPTIFVALGNAAMKVEIRRFCRKHGLRVIRIRAYPNHFGVDFMEGDRRKYRQWPKEFEEYRNKPQQDAPCDG